MRSTGYAGRVGGLGEHDDGGEAYVRAYADAFDHRPVLIRIGFDEEIPTVYGLLTRSVALVSMEVDTARALRRQLADLLDRVDTDTLRPEDGYDWDDEDEDITG